MSIIHIDGGTPLIGNVKLSGAKNSILKLIPAAMFSNEDIVIDNVPQVTGVLEYVTLIKSMGARAEWISSNRLILNGSSINTYEIPYAFGREYRVAALLAVPIVYRFGKAIIPQPHTPKGSLSISRWMEAWKSLGLNVEVDDKYIKVESGNIAAANISFKVSTHTGTDNAIISSLFAPGETTINNAAEEPEVDDLIEFVNMIGGDVKRIEPRKIRVNGRNVFKGGKFTVQSDKNEAVYFAVQAVLTKGNITIQKVDKTHLTSFINVITKMKCKYEVSKDELRVWSGGEQLEPVTVTTSPAPGFVTDWQPLMVLLSTQAVGEGLVHDTVYTDRFDHIKDLNRMGAKIELFKPSEVGMRAVISDESYDIERFGEPTTVAKITGPSRLKGTKMHLSDPVSATTLISAACSAEGRSEISGIETLEILNENILDKTADLGAKITLIE
ncbi:MAG: UDP-N-acetylglucosamine 1-carboxyvinyltransferase [candidate division WWE3 bacterium GW2011_GWC1_41_7]|uniref:UDP-N-acetylglucosamine 1-carboxyvinyltransferase n=3 Tax=Katanobacteria TaxID=422282 RepID=A0A0G0X7F4_UNCKA|nr:MAG: UDP-N-acetylglucosamine 1-carboxyvinyltransferase [candidate division WWE3 bacterium GW2011_GWB1_41_6]KKS20870.1 MAG: UDP-N-acetylglucosamine 1-carboxyvinyltransferase [candidate division WWE3 bacterium GW2011_GWA1_41_8]KKS21345.1 MAG: UDP-N-acetylglucosamine 1-carboxyvinyltransferase [candidate division WWE3 bacterium GW2011_GWC1_41_7]